MIDVKILNTASKCDQICSKLLEEKANLIAKRSNLRNLEIDFQKSVERVEKQIYQKRMHLKHSFKNLENPFSNRRERIPEHLSIEIGHKLKILLQIKAAHKEYPLEKIREKIDEMNWRIEDLEKDLKLVETHKSSLK